MHDIISFLKDAVTRAPGGGVNSCYVVRNGSIYGRNAAMQAGIEWPDASTFSISADALDIALARMKVVQSLTVEEDTVILKAGRLRSTIKRNHDEPPPLPDFPDEWQRSPPGLGAALTLAKQFIGDRIWTQGIRLLGDRVTAFSGAAGIDVALPGLELDEPYLLPEAVAAFIAAQGDPDELVPERNAISFRWEDGRWLRAQLINDVMPENMIQTIFGKVGDEAPVKIDQEWREALADAAALSDGTVGLSAAGLHGIREAITTDVDLGVDVDSHHMSYWDAKKLSTVIEVATAWNPSAYQDPALFIGPNFRGVIAGVKR